jgi:hypothetical protein
MKSLLKRTAAACACLVVSISLYCQTNENFDSRAGINSPQVMEHLQDHCWQFSNFAMNIAGELAIHGDGAVVSNAGASLASLYTPVLNTWGGVTFSFQYTFDQTASSSRSVNIYTTNANNETLTLVESIDVSSAAANTIYTYTKTLPATSSIYKLLFTYNSGGTAVRMKLDDLLISVNKRYPNGCNDAPTAVSDVITGQASRQASGYILQNDKDPNAEAFSCYLINDSKDGKVTLGMNGYFTFTPNPGFTGTYTSFTYQICDYGYTQLCSEQATVIVTFPAMLPADINDLKATHNNNLVTLKWFTTSESNTHRFEIERSIDGVNFEKAGYVQALGNSNIKSGYVYDDRVSEKLARKNDLYYRLKQVDVNGKADYSKILLVRVFKTKTLQAVSVSPNPTVNDIRVHLQLNEPAYVAIKVRSINGDEVLRNSVKAFKGDNSFTMEGSEKLKKGVYMLEVIVNSNERMLVKLIKN